jgi:SnoaL-like domain
VDRHAFEVWLQQYGDAWERQDADAAADLFSMDTKYYETPFDAPMTGREAVRSYWNEGTTLQRDISFGYDVLAMNGETGIARWTSSFRRVPSGVAVRLDGVLTARFDSEGRCSEFREWWHRKEGSGRRRKMR